MSRPEKIRVNFPCPLGFVKRQKMSVACFNEVILKILQFLEYSFSSSTREDSGGIYDGRNTDHLENLDGTAC